jgi:hypothetical protein
MAASLSPSARSGPVAAIMLSVHTMKGVAAEDTQIGGVFMVFKWLPSESIRLLCRRQCGYGSLYRISEGLSTRRCHPS